MSTYHLISDKSGKKKFVVFQTESNK